MANLSTSLLNASNALGVYSQALQVVENNVTNASTPGYATQTPNFEAMPLDVSVGLPGGVSSGPVESSRSAFAEQNVRDQQTALGSYQQTAAALTQVQSLFSISGSNNLSSAMDGLFNSFSQLSINPNDTTTRQSVLNSATELAGQFNQISNGLSQSSSGEHQQVQNEVNQINQIAGTIAQLNSQGGVQSKAGLDAQMNNALEELSQYTNFTALQQPGGTVNVYIGGQSPLVLGDQAQNIQADFSSPQAVIRDNQGNDITSQITGGQLHGDLNVYNNLIPSYISGLNTLAQSIADQVNQGLANGLDQNGNTPTQNLFAYNAANPAATLSVNPLTPDQIAAAAPATPGSNGNALSLSNLGSAPALNRQSFAQYYGGLAAQVGQDFSNAQGGESSAQQLLTQAQSLRSNLSGVSLDAQAEQLIQYQNGYQAVSKMITVLDSLTQDVINLLPPVTS